MSDSVKKAFRIIRLLAEAPEPRPLAAVSRELQMDKATAFRYLETLGQLGAAEKTKTGYRLGLTLFELGNRVAVKQVLINRVDPFMRALCKAVNETVNLAQLHQDRALYLHKIESRRSLQMRADIGSVLPLHCTALGKAIMASLEPGRAQDLMVALTLKAHTPATILQKARLQEEIEKVRRRGYATDLEEFEVGLTCVAIPLTLPAYEFYGALSVSAPSLRMSSASVVATAARLQRTRSAILDALAAPGNAERKKNR